MLSSSSSFICAICLEEVLCVSSVYIETACGHCFCQKCLVEYIYHGLYVMRSVKIHCPLCRTILSAAATENAFRLAHERNAMNQLLSKEVVYRGLFNFFQLCVLIMYYYLVAINISYLFQTDEPESRGG